MSKKGKGTKQVNPILLSIEAAAERKMRPHEWLWMVASGAPIDHNEEVEFTDLEGNTVTKYKPRTVYPSMKWRIECAKAAAPYYAPKLAFDLTADSEDSVRKIGEAMEEMATKLLV